MGGVGGGNHELPVDVSTMANLHESDGKTIVVDLIEDAKIPLPEAEMVFAGELLASWRTRLI